MASPSGSDSSPGAESSPYRSAQKLVQSLSAGQTGCLRQGTYTGSDLFLDAPGATLRSYPGERATIAAFLEVRPDAARAKVTQLRFDGTNVSNSTAVKLQANNTVFSDNEVTKGGKGICVQAGSYYPGRDIIIERNRIHNCGPADSKFDHQLYLGQTRNAVVRWNILTNNPGGWGVHLYTDADNTLIEHNIIDGNRGGVIFAGEGGKHSDNNTVRNNAITNNGPRWNIEGSWSGGPQGTGNTATNNCVYTTGPDAPAGIANNNGFTTTNNTVLNTTPYINRTTGDYRFKPGHPCTTLVGLANARTAGSRKRKARRPARLTLRRKRRRVRPGQRAVFYGTIATGLGGRRVRLQMREGRRWRTVRRAQLQAGGRYAVVVRTTRSRRSRTRRFRAVIPRITRSRSVRLRISR